MSAQNKTGGTAFPNHTLEPNPDGGQPRIIWQEGMTLRDYFAAKALQGMLASELEDDVTTIDSYARDSYRIADAMLKAREQ